MKASKPRESSLEVATFEVGEPGVGVAFLVTSNIAVTCAHVVEDLGVFAGLEVALRSLRSESTIRAKVLSKGWRVRDQEDLAFLMLPEDAVANISPLPLGYSVQREGHVVRALGFPAIKNEKGVNSFRWTWARGLVNGLTKRREGGALCLQLELNVEPGFSGAPVFDIETQHVIGIITEAGKADPYRKLDDIAWATPAELILESLGLDVASLAHSATSKLERFRISPRLCEMARAEQFFGREPELAKMGRFWRSDKAKVLTIMGIGGAGKTALTRHFLEQQGWLMGGLDAYKGERPPHALFSWSFYNRPNAEDFLFELARYLKRVVESESTASWLTEGSGHNVHDLCSYMAGSVGRILVVMDGFEKMQSDGKASDLSRGRIYAPSLREFLAYVLDGGCGDTKVILSSRISLSDLDDWDGYEEIKLPDLDAKAARRLLQSLGVTGSDGDLDTVLRRYGRHALTIDLVGRLLVEYHGGDPAEVRKIGRVERSRGTTRVEKQAVRLAKVLSAYEQSLQPAYIQLLVLLGFFRRPISLSVLSDILVDERRIPSLELLSELSTGDLWESLHVLADFGLLSIERSEGEELYSSHPLIRDYFFGVHLSNKEVAIQEVTSRYITLIDIPGPLQPFDLRTILAIEEAIFLSLLAKRGREAYRLYRERLGGYLHLGWELGFHVTGAEIGAEIAQTLEAGLSPSEQARLWIDEGLYLKNLGSLERSAKHFASVANLGNLDSGTIAQAFQNLSAVQVLMGRLPDAEATAKSAVEWAYLAKSDRQMQDCVVRLATSLALRGQSLEAEALFRVLRYDDNVRPLDWPGIRFAWLLMRLGRYDESRTLLELTLKQARGLGYGIIEARAAALMAELEVRSGDYIAAKRSLKSVEAWSSKAFDQEMRLAISLVGASVAIAEEDWRAARLSIAKGLRIAESGGYSLYWIEIKIRESRIGLRTGDLGIARRCLRQALEGRGGRRALPRLWGAGSVECGYVWGEAEIRKSLCELELGSV